MFQNAIHHHMTNEQPMIIFLHYWGTGPAETLATYLKLRWTNSANMASVAAVYDRRYFVDSRKNRRS